MADVTPPGYTNDEAMIADDGGPHDDGGTREDIYQFLDPLDPRKVSLDIFEMYCHELVHANSIGRMAYIMDKTKYMVGRMIGHQFPYGRLYNNTCMANIVARVCARQPYSNDDPNADGYYLHLVDCLVDLPAEKWKKIITQFEELRNSLLRRDAALLVLPDEVYDDSNNRGGTQDELPTESESVNPSLESSQEFTQTYDKVLQSLKFHMCLSHIRPQFEKALRTSDDEAVVMSHDDIMAFDNEIEEAFGDDGGKNAEVLNSLFETTKKRGRLRLKKIDEIKDIYGTNEQLFDLSRLQKKLLHLIRRWSVMVLPLPELTQLGYGCAGLAVGVDNKENIESALVTDETVQQRKQKRRRVDESSSNGEFEEDGEEKNIGVDDGEEDKEDNLGRLKRTRKALMKNVEDPLDDCVAKAQSARTRSETQAVHTTSESERKVSTPTFLKKKKNSYKIAFSDSEDDDVPANAKGKAEESKADEGKAEENTSKTNELVDSEEEDEGVKLSSVPERFKSALPEKEKVTVSKASGPKKGKRRKKFTEAEDEAIRDGVAKIGAGNWSEIKSYYHIDLADRTAVQIKDRWRTLNK